MTPALLVVGGGWPFRARASFFRQVSARRLGVAVADLWHAEGLTAADLPVPCRTLDIADVAAGLDRRAGEVELRGVTCLQDVGLVPSALLASACGLPGPAVAGARAARDKVLQRTLLCSAGLPVPRWRPVHGVAELAGVLAELGPVVVKPTRGTASHGVRLLSSPADAEAAYAHAAGMPEGTLDGVTVLAEEYVEGAEFSVETVSTSSVHHVAACTRKISGPLPYFVEIGHSTAVEEATAELLAGCATAALSAIGFDHGVSHTELRIGPDGPVIIEINGRAAGDLIPTLHQLTGRADLHQAAVAMALGEPVPPVAEPLGSAAIRYLDAAEVLAIRRLLAADDLPPELWTMSLPRQPEDGPVTWSGQRAGYLVMYDKNGPGAEQAASALVTRGVHASA